MNLRPNHAVVLGWFASFVILVGLGQAQTTDTVESLLAEASKSLNAKCPMQIDQDTRLESTVAGPGRRLTYICTAMNVPADLAGWVREKRTWLINSYKTVPGLSTFRSYGVELCYEYLDSAGKHVARISVSPADFQ